MTSTYPPEPDLARIVRRLTPVGPEPRSRVDQALRASMTALLGHGPVAWTAETVETGVAIGAEFSRREGIPFPAVEVGRNMEVVLLNILVQLAGGPTPGSLSEAAPQRVRDSAGPGYPAVKMAEGMRLVHRAWSERLLRHAVSSGATMTEMSELTSALANIVDALMEHVLGSDIPADESDDSHTHPSRREETIQALVDGRPLTDDAVAGSLGIRLADQHLALVLGRAAHPENGPAVASSADRLAHWLSPYSVTRLEVAPGVIWLWATGLDLPSSLVVLSALHEITTPVGIGSVRRGAQGFRRSHLEAMDAARLTRLDRPVVAYENIELVALLGSDLERARWFVHDMLGPLAGRGRPYVELRETLLAFYRLKMNVTMVAGELELHRNTVVQRLQRAEELLGQEVRNDLTRLMPALVLAESLGDQLLEAPGDDAPNAPR